MQKDLSNVPDDNSLMCITALLMGLELWNWQEICKSSANSILIRSVLMRSKDLSSERLTGPFRSLGAVEVSNFYTHSFFYKHQYFSTQPQTDAKFTNISASKYAKVMLIS